MRTFKQKLEKQWEKGKFVCVGLDPDVRKFPTHLKSLHTEEQQVFDFLKEVIDSTAKIVAAFKPNCAFFEKFGFLGARIYVMICQYIKAFHPDVVLICDAKRGDIENTNNGSAEFFFDRCGGDALTIHGYLGPEANQPFLKRADKGVFMLCRTSNSGAGEFQDRMVEITPEEARMFNLPAGKQSAPFDYEISVPEAEMMARELYARKRQMPLYQFVAARVSHFWNEKGNCGLVTGATYPEEIKMVRQVAPHLPLLIPGIGKQGGDLEKSVRAARMRFLISSSRDILYASHGEDFAQVARAKAIELDKQIRALVAER